MFRGLIFPRNKHDANIANRIFVSERTQTGACGYDLALKRSKGCDNIFNLTVCKCLL